MVTHVVNLRKEKYDAYIGRGSIWGNPFVIGRDGTREGVIEMYRRHVCRNTVMLNMLYALEGKVLGCFCKPKPCHGDVLVRLVSERHLFQMQKWKDKNLC